MQAGRSKSFPNSLRWKNEIEGWRFKDLTWKRGMWGGGKNLSARAKEVEGAGRSGAGAVPPGASEVLLISLRLLSPLNSVALQEEIERDAKTGQVAVNGTTWLFCSLVSRWNARTERRTRPRTNWTDWSANQAIATRDAAELGRRYAEPASFRQANFDLHPGMGLLNKERFPTGCYRRRKKIGGRR